MNLVVLGLFTAMQLAAANPPASCAGSLILGVDHSNSISLPQLAAWRPMAQKRIDALCPGDHLRIFLIDANTLSNTPLIDEAVPVRPDPATVEQLIQFRNRLITFRKDASAALDKAFSGPINAKATDIFSLFDRFDLAGQKTEFLLFTDGLEDARDLDLEKTRLVSDTFPAVIQKLAAFHRWDGQKLSGASVRFVLPSPAVNGPSPGVNDQRKLGDFDRVLISSLGGNLSLFDTYIH